MCPLQLTMLLSQVILVASCVVPAILGTRHCGSQHTTKLLGRSLGKGNKQPFQDSICASTDPIYHLYRRSEVPQEHSLRVWQVIVCVGCVSPDARFLQQFYSAKVLCESKGASTMGPSRNPHFGKERNC